MGKKERLQNRVTRIDNRFKEKVRKGKKGTDMDIAIHEERIQRLADKGGFSAPFMAKSPLNTEKKFIKNPKFNELTQEEKDEQRDIARNNDKGHTYKGVQIDPEDGALSNMPNPNYKK